MFKFIFYRKLFILFTFFYCESFGQTYYQIRIDGQGLGSDEAKSIIQSADGGYIVAGVGRLSAGSLITFTTVKLDATFNIQWTFNYLTYTAAPNDNQARDVIQLSDGSYIIAGSVNAGAAGCAQFPDLCLVKLATDGTYQWSYQRDRGACLNGRAKSVVETTDGGYIMIGDDEDGTSFQMCAIKVNSSGTFQWVRFYGGGSTEYGQKIIRTSTVENYVIAGITNSSGQGAADLWIKKIDNTGAVIWGRTLGGPVADGQTSAGGLCGLIEDADGGYVVASSTQSYGQGLSDVYVAKLSSSGSLLWTRTVGGVGNDFGYSIALTSDGGYIIAGSTFSYGAGSSDMYIVKLTSTGALSWTKTYGGTGADAAYSIIQNTDGNYVVAGYTQSFGKADRDMFIVSFNSAGDGCANLGNGGSSSSGGILATYTATTSPAGGTNTANAGIQGSVGSTTTVCANVALPIELLSFSGRYSDGKVFLNWATASEQNNNYFTIEKSSDGKSFEEIGKVNGSGNSSTIRHYNLTDNQLETSNLKTDFYYYRLKQTDFDGIFSYSDILSVRLVPDEGIIIHTNPTNTHMMISFGEKLEGKNCLIKIYDMSGRVGFSSLFLPNKSKKEMWIDMSNWSKGVYMISAFSENGLLDQKKFVKQ